MQTWTDFMRTVRDLDITIVRVNTPNGYVRMDDDE